MVKIVCLLLVMVAAATGQNLAYSVTYNEYGTSASPDLGCSNAATTAFSFVCSGSAANPVMAGVCLTNITALRMGFTAGWNNAVQSAKFTISSVSGISVTNGTANVVAQLYSDTSCTTAVNTTWGNNGDTCQQQTFLYAATNQALGPKSSNLRVSWTVAACFNSTYTYDDSDDHNPITIMLTALAIVLGSALLAIAIYAITQSGGARPKETTMQEATPPPPSSAGAVMGTVSADDNMPSGASSEDVGAV